ncbi:notch-like transmembrane receptor LIN-12 [Brachionus plicatilis]|uniref:Notch-like transmembrane receptor LIN-12 n=1 Tax=Brachionus plicatilis TaxID=10195 RepID=A0A3M7R161_BRAPC|nr:notch-like transmembrane receptor LIN-12 [Brachionus plicatilis]
MILQNILISALIIAIKTDAQFDGCKSNPCLNGATCIYILEKSTTYECICPPGFSGPNCDQKKSFDSEEDYSKESDRSMDKECLNGGKFVRSGLPCSCPNGYSGSKCEIYSSNRYCTSTTCLNDGICHQYGSGLKCQCQGFYYGPRCEYIRSYSYSRRTTGISSFSSLLMIIGLIALIAYCFCFKQKRNETGPFLTGNNGFSGVVLRQGAAPCPFPQTPYFNPNPLGSNFSYPTNVSILNPLPRTQIPDPEEASRINQAPPSYEEVLNMRKT